MPRCSLAFGFIMSWTSACSDTASTTSSAGGCPNELREVALDARFGDETPGEVIQLLKRPVTGSVTWIEGGSEYVDITGATGTTSFAAQAQVGPTVWVIDGVEGQGGVPEERLTCPTMFRFDVSVHIESDDGALAEEWRGPGTYIVSGTLGGEGAVSVLIQDPPSFAGTLRVIERPGAEEWPEHELRVTLNFATYPLNFVGMSGFLQHFLLDADSDEGGGVKTTIAEFAWPETSDTTGG